MRTFLSKMVLWKDITFILEVLKAFCFFIVAILVSHYAVGYATLHASSSVSDTLFNLTSMVDTSYIHIWIAFYLYYVVFALLIVRPKYLLFSLYALGSLIFTRSLFVNLTNLGVPEGAPNIGSFFTQQGDLFFSGHVALPYILALIFWENKLIRYIFMCISLFMAVSVILGHQHYSIDVVAAPFITYGIFTLSKKIFKKSYAIIK